MHPILSSSSPTQLSLLYSKEIEDEIRKRQTIFAPSEAIVFTYGAITSSSVRSLFAASPTRLERGLYYKDQPYALDRR